MFETQLLEIEIFSSILKSLSAYVIQVIDRAFF